MSVRRLIALPAFQSAPLTEARGDRVPPRYCGSHLNQFQSAPLTEARGDLRQKSRMEQTIQNGKFQSAPLTEARGDPKSFFWREAAL